MEVKLLHLYDDVMNLYGDYANIAVLARYLQDSGCSVRTDTLSLYETKDISGYDFYYMGAGTEHGQKLALSQLQKYGAALHDAYEAGKVMLFTGNSFELLGASVTDADGKSYESLKLFPFTSMEGKRRITGDCLAKMQENDTLLVGFMNKCSTTHGIKHPLFSLLMGFGNECERGAEGIRERNCFGTHLAGPVLVKNPVLLRTIGELLGIPAEQGVLCPYMQPAYETTVDELKKRLEAMK